MPFNIAIVGSGISGLAAAIALSKDGHTVNVYERRGDTQHDSGAGLQVQPPVLNILRSWNLFDEFAKVAHEAGGLKFRRYADSKVKAVQKREGERAQWYCLRNALRRLLYDAAIASGAKVHFNMTVLSVDFEAPSLQMANDSTVTADLIVAADGTGSVIRQLMHPGARRVVTDTYCFQASIPREVVEQDASLAELYKDPATQIYMGQNMWSFTSIAPHQNIYDIQLLIRGFEDTGRDPHPRQLLETLPNLDLLSDKVDDWDPCYKDALARTTKGFFKWRINLAPQIPTALAKSGKVVLIGDAAHAVDPSAGFGAALALEDGLTFSLLLRKANSTSEFPVVLGIFDHMMLERARAAGKYSHYMGRFMSVPDGPMQEMRDKQLSLYDPSKKPGVVGSVNSKFQTPEWQAYLDDYICEIAVDEAWQKHQGKMNLAPGSVVSRT